MAEAPGRTRPRAQRTAEGPMAGAARSEIRRGFPYHSTVPVPVPVPTRACNVFYHPSPRGGGGARWLPVVLKTARYKHLHQYVPVPVPVPVRTSTDALDGRGCAQGRSLTAIRPHPHRGAPKKGAEKKGEGDGRARPAKPVARAQLSQWRAQSGGGGAVAPSLAPSHYPRFQGVGVKNSRVTTANIYFSRESI